MVCGSKAVAREFAAGRGQGYGIYPLVWSIPIIGKPMSLYRFGPLGWLEARPPDVREDPGGFYTSILHRLRPNQAGWEFRA